VIVRWICALALCAAALDAQGLLEDREIMATSTPYTPRLSTAIKVDARLVEVTVVVRNGKGEAIPGLRREDFEIRDEGKKRDITSFVAEASERSVTHTASGAAPGASQPAGPGAKARTRWIGLLFDDLNSSAPELISARIAALRFLKEGLEPGDHLSVFTTYGRQVVAFTTDVAQIAAALNKLAPHPVKADYNLCPSMRPYEAYLITSRTDPGVLPVKVDEARRCSGSPPPPRSRRGQQGGDMESSSDPIVEQVIGLARNIWEQTRATSRNTFGAVSDVVDYMAQYKGERLLVCASGGFYSGTLETEQDELINRALHAGVVIDSLDAKGLYVQEAPQLGLGGNVRSVIMQQSMGTRPQESANDALAGLAYGTGGIFFHNNNDLTAGLREMMAPEVTYLLGFSPGGSPDNKYHRLKVRVSAAGHYDVQARPGYVAIATAPVTETAPRKIDEAALGLDARPDAAVTIGSTMQTTADGSKAFAALLHLDLKRMTFREAFGIRNQRVAFIATLTDAQGNFVTGKEYTIDFALKEATYEKYAAGGFNAAAVLQAPRGKYRLRGVADLGNGAIAAATLDVEIP
jgi:VWFA-related protein